ncbi:MAG TPA: hypothetical protein VE955_12760 [Candidatus Dormibacteraeota bacterium]|jgi:hypothetical protein|nr:hypothetical protein [Candidatus Dormibacteraeota bacterium]
MQQSFDSQAGPALKYFDDWSKKKYQASAQYLDDNLSFKGPIDTFNNSKDYLKTLDRLATIIVEVKTRKTFVDGKDACFVYDLVTNTPAGTVPCAEWIHSDQGKVKSIQVFFDARPFAAMFGHK